MEGQNIDVYARVERLYKQLDGQRSNWNTLWRFVGEYVSYIKQDFDQEHSQGESLVENVFDDSANFAAKQGSSALLGLLWPSTAENSIEIMPPPDLEAASDQEKAWYTDVVTPVLTQAMDSDATNLQLALQEYMLDQFVFGTSGIGTFYEDGKLLYIPYSVKELYIDEGREGTVDTVILMYHWTAYRIIQEYGEDNVHEEIRKFKDDATRKFKIAIVYAPVERIAPEEKDPKFPIKNLHVDLKNKKVMQDDGHFEMPIHVGRFAKKMNERYGRSPAIDAKPTIVDINNQRENYRLAVEYLWKPALVVPSNNILGNGVIDISPGAANSLDASAFANGVRDPIKPIFSVDPRGVQLIMERIAQLTDTLSRHFLIDKLLDFNNQTQMTATEAGLRSNIRNSALSSLIQRQNAELIIPMIRRTFNLLLRANRFGYKKNDADSVKMALAAEKLGEEVSYIPDRIAERIVQGGKAIIDIKFKTPAYRLGNSDKLEGMLQHVNFQQTLASTNPEAIEQLDIRQITEQGTDLFGSPPEIIRDSEEVEAAVAQKAQAQSDEQSLMMLNEVQKNAPRDNNQQRAG